MDRRKNLMWMAGGILIGSLGLILFSSLMTGRGMARSAQAGGPQRPNILRALSVQNTQNPAGPTQDAGGSGARKPNILFIMGDDIGWMQPSIYHRGLMVGETPNIDRIGKEGAIFMDYVAMQSCTSGRNAFFTGMYPLRTGMIPPQLPGSPSYLRPGTPALAKFLLDLGYTTGEFGKNHLGDHTASLPTAHGFQEYWGYLYHLDAMQQVSFPDINRTPTDQGIVTVQEHTDPRRPRGPWRCGSQDHDLPDTPASGPLVPFLERHDREPDV